MPGEELYSYNDYSAIVGARTMIGIESIDYDHERKVEVFYGKGAEPVGYGEGEEKTSGKMTILLEEFENLVIAAAAYKGNPLRLPPFPIVGIATKTTTNKSFKETLPLVKLKKVGHKRKAGDTKFVVDIDFEGLMSPIWVPL